MGTVTINSNQVLIFIDEQWHIYIVHAQGAVCRM
jgi:hypothetical protein